MAIDLRIQDQIKREVLFTPCASKEHLHSWIKVYLGLDLPNCIVCDDDFTTDPSNSSPMDLIWEIYTKALEGNDPKFQKILAYAARDSFKTVSCAILEILCLFHLKRNVAHMAAIESQAAKCQSYVERYFQRPIIREFLNTKNKRTIEIMRYEAPDGSIISPIVYDKLTLEEKLTYTPKSNYMRILIATMAGANCVDPVTQISMADGTTKEALEVVPGDKVLSFNVDAQEYTPMVVKEVGTTQKSRMRISFSDGGSIIVSEDHPVFTGSGWIPARALRLMDKCLGTKTVAAESLELTRSEITVDNPWSVVLGTLLGDSSLVWPTGPNGKYGVGPRLQLFHSAKQMDLIRGVRTALVRLGIKSSVCPDQDGFKLSSSVDSRFIELYELLYSQGQKEVTQAYLDKLDIESVAWWMMDDASGNPERVGSRKDHCISIATCSFSEESHKLIVKWFDDKFKLQPYVDTVTNSSKKKYPVTKFTLGDSRVLSGYVEKYFIPAVKYKLVPTFAMQAGRCIKCDTKTLTTSRPGFTYCTKHSDLNERQVKKSRDARKKFKSLLGVVISKLEFLEPAHLMDIHLDTEDKHLQNFIGNGILLHNSEHVPFLVLDELDLAKPKPVEEAKMIPSQGENGEFPITFMTSSRKFAFGLVNEELKNAVKSRLVVRHWNIIDVTKSCAPERHLPAEPRIPIYYSEHDLTSKSQAEFDLLSPEEQTRFHKGEGYTGCLQNCSLFAMCRGRLATKQLGKSPLLKDIEIVTNLFNTVTVETAKSQLMSWAPSSIGLIYPNFSPTRHVITAAEMAEKITGDKVWPGFHKGDLIALMKQRQMAFHIGMDFGFSHNFATVAGALDGNRFFVFDCEGVPGLEVNQKVTLCQNKYLHLDATYYPDPASPSDIKTFKRAGFRCKKFDKDVLLGIDAVRTKLLPGPNRDPEIFFLRGDAGVDGLVNEMVKYHWQMDDLERPTDEPEKEDDDRCDALRYVCQNLFGSRTRLQMALQGGKEKFIFSEAPRNWLQTKIRELTHDSPPDGAPIKKGSFIFKG